MAKYEARANRLRSLPGHFNDKVVAYRVFVLSALLDACSSPTHRPESPFENRPLWHRFLAPRCTPSPIVGTQRAWVAHLLCAAYGRPSSGVEPSQLRIRDRSRRDWRRETPAGRPAAPQEAAATGEAHRPNRQGEGRRTRASPPAAIHNSQLTSASGAAMSSERMACFWRPDALRTSGFHMSVGLGPAPGDIFAMGPLVGQDLVVLAYGGRSRSPASGAGGCV